MLVVLVLLLSLTSLAYSYRTIIHNNDRYNKLYMNKGFGKPVSSSFKYVGKLKPGVRGPKRIVDPTIMRPDYAETGKPIAKDKGQQWEIIVQTPDDIERMRKAGKIAREVLDAAVRFVKPGITTDDIDRLVHEETVKRNAYPSPLNYHGYPKSCCTSINEVICHGIPDSTIVNDGDIINVDVTIYYDGVHGDCSETILVGNVDPKLKDLVETTYTAWKAAINHCKPGVKYNEIGGIIEDIVSAKGYTTVKEFCGHGVGRIFHAMPNVLHYKNNIRSGVMAPGHTFTIEPMICLGSPKPFYWPDEWTVTTSDGLATAQFEHTLLITETGVEELTGKLSTSPKYSWEQ
jgi:methionyl aminopeptidase